jgi:hypothetical protein
MGKPITDAECRFVDEKISTALSKAGLPTTSSLRSYLSAEAEIFDTGRDLIVRIPRANGDLSLGDRLGELSEDSGLKAQFPAKKPTVDKRDLRTMSENFDAIASGKITVK